MTSNKIADANLYLRHSRHSVVFLFTLPTPRSALTLSHSGEVTSVASAEGDPSCRKGWNSDGKDIFFGIVST